MVSGFSGAVQAPGRLVDYVVVRQLLRLLHGERSRAYWQALEQVMWDWSIRRRNLEEEAGLFW